MKNQTQKQIVVRDAHARSFPLRDEGVKRGRGVRLGRLVTQETPPRLRPNYPCRARLN